MWEALATSADLPTAVRVANRRLRRPLDTGVTIATVVAPPPPREHEGPTQPEEGRIVVPIRRGRRLVGALHVAVDRKRTAALEPGFVGGLAAAFSLVIERVDAQRQLDRLGDRRVMPADMAAPAWAAARRHIARVGTGLAGALQDAREATPANLSRLLNELSAAHRALRRGEGGALYLARDVDDLRSSLRWLAGEFGAATGISVAAQVRGEQFPVDPAVAYALFALAVDWLLTAELDARAAAVTIVLSYSTSDVTLSMRDDGVSLVHRPLFGTPWAVRSLQRAIEHDGGAFRISNVAPRGVEAVASFAAEVRVR